MIKKYEGFFDIFKKKDKVEPVAKKSISYDDATELSNDCFIELIDKGYTVKTGYMGTPYVQITKHPTIRGRLRQDRDIPIKFIDIKNDVLSFCDRLKSIYDIDTKFGHTFTSSGFDKIPDDDDYFCTSNQSNGMKNGLDIIISLLGHRR